MATSDDVPGLVAESADYRQLQTMVMELIPVLLVENDLVVASSGVQNVPVHIAANALSKRRALVSV